MVQMDKEQNSIIMTRLHFAFAFAFSKRIEASTMQLDGRRPLVVNAAVAQHYHCLFQRLCLEGDEILISAKLIAYKRKEQL
ncbi:hypothetical protein T11_9410 [Trichinella zimbabwensis]|uniref:Uncharacterized protein n=1 Tax=Trichinella zimbabwensis TaxID=268475 RepID=A0A0V1HEE6_9BILA|nr:hypothetical protein T11_9410 [Trichinella zimbabwensis]